MERLREEELIKEIDDLEKIGEENDVGLLEGKKEELEAIRKKKVEGLIVRSRAKWIEEGEINSKYFTTQTQMMSLKVKTLLKRVLVE